MSLFDQDCPRDMDLDEFEARFRRTTFTSNPVSSSDVTPETFTLVGVKAHTFATSVESSLDIYVRTFISLAKSEHTGTLITDMIAIGLQVKNSQGERIITVLTGQSGATYPGVNNAVIQNWQEYKTQINNDTALTTAAKKVTELSQSEFQRWLECHCFVWLKAIYKESDQILDKFSNLQRGLNLLGVHISGSLVYWNYTDNYLNTLKKMFNNHLLRKPVAATLISSYYTNKNAGHGARCSFMSWGVMTSTYLMGFGVVRLVLAGMAILNTSLADVLEILADPRGVKEILKYYEICNRVLDTPAPETAEELIFFKWSGMISDHFHVSLRLPVNPYSSSVLIGLMDGAREAAGLPDVSITTFKPTQYKHNYYQLGKYIAREGNNEALGRGIGRYQDIRVQVSARAEPVEPEEQEVFMSDEEQ